MIPSKLAHGGNRILRSSGDPTRGVWQTEIVFPLPPSGGAHENYGRERGKSDSVTPEERLRYWPICIITGSKHITFVLAVIPEGERLPWHGHEGAEEVICVLQGTGSAYWDTEMKAVHPGTVRCMEADSNHRIVNEGKGEAKLLCAVSPKRAMKKPKKRQNLLLLGLY